MLVKWYYVENNDRIGPLEESQMIGLIKEGSVGKETYVWKKGFENWTRLEEVNELSPFLQSGVEQDITEELIEEKAQDQEEAEVDVDMIIDPSSSQEKAQEEAQEETEIVTAADELKEGEDLKQEDEGPLESDVAQKDVPKYGPYFEEINWDEISENENIFSIKIGYDRDAPEVEYGPFSIKILEKLFDEKRINSKTYVFTPGMENWSLLGDLPIYNKISNNIPPVIEDCDRRRDVRKPFVAKLFFHDNKKVYEGVCRDISIGGLQLLVSYYPAKIGDLVSLNVHPDNSAFSFVASGKIVRILSGDQGFSIRFIDLGPEAQQAINSYIDET